jgi:hypothetical protein
MAGIDLDTTVAVVLEITANTKCVVKADSSCRAHFLKAPLHA